MATIDYGSGGSHEILASAYTLLVYEQEFGRDLIADEFGRIDLRDYQTDLDENGNLVVIDYTIDNWNAHLRTLWALLKTASDRAARAGKPYEDIPSFNEWVRGVGDIDMPYVSRVVTAECQRGLFRAGAADPERKTSE